MYIHNYIKITFRKWPFQHFQERPLAVQCIDVFFILWPFAVPFKAKHLYPIFLKMKLILRKTNYAAIKNLVQHKTSCLGMLKKKDKESRSFFARLFKKSEEIEQAEEELDKLRHELSKAYDAWKSLLKSKEEQAVYYDNAISAVRKVYNRPTYSERKEMKKLERHRDKLTSILTNTSELIHLGNLGIEKP